MRRRRVMGVMAAALAVHAGLIPMRANSAAAGEPIRIGVLHGPHEEVAAFVGSLLRQQGIALETRTRTDANQINRELAQGALSAACAQSAVALDQAVRREKLPLMAVTPTLTLPVGIYSRHVRQIGELPRGARIAIPDQGELATRALVLLHNYGLIQLRYGNGLHARLRDVQSTRRELRLMPLAPEPLRRSLEPGSHIADASLLGYGDADALGLRPARDSIGIEDSRTPFADVLAVRRTDSDAPWLVHLVAAYHSEPVKRFLLERYQESVRRPW